MTIDKKEVDAGPVRGSQSISQRGERRLLVDWLFLAFNLVTAIAGGGAVGSGPIVRRRIEYASLLFIALMLTLLSLSLLPEWYAFVPAGVALMTLVAIGSAIAKRRWPKKWW